MDARQRFIVIEACTILESVDLSGDNATFKTEMLLRSVAQIIRLATGLPVGGVSD